MKKEFTPVHGLLKVYIILIVLISVSSCSEDSSPILQTDINDTEDNYDLSIKEDVIKLYKDVYIETDYSDAGWTGNINNCDPGDISASARKKTLDRVNYFRKMAGVELVDSINQEWNEMNQHATLIMKANSIFSHDLGSHLDCYTELGRQGALSSNISTGQSAKVVTAFIKDEGSFNNDVGHRRSLLSIYGTAMGYGSSGTYSALKIAYGGQLKSSEPAYVIWPAKITPAPLVFEKWSFSARGGKFNNATVKVTDSDGKILTVDIVSTDAPYGDPSIVFIPQNIDLDTNDKVYNVELNNVVINGENKSFNYSVTIVQI